MVSVHTYPTFELSGAVPLLKTTATCRERKLGPRLEPLPYLKHTITLKGTITVLLVVLQLHCNSGGYKYFSGRKSVQVHCLAGSQSRSIVIYFKFVLPARQIVTVCFNPLCLLHTTLFFINTSIINLICIFHE